MTYWQSPSFVVRSVIFAELRGGVESTPPSPFLLPLVPKEQKKKSGLKSFNLHFSYASSESKRIHNMAAATGVTTAVKAAEEKLKSLSLDSNPPGTEKLR